MIDTCKKCGKPLGYCKTIFAANGDLYCSEKCGRKDSENFDDVSEEIQPFDIGIKPHRNYKITGVDRNGKRFKPIYTNFPKHFNIYCGTVWNILPNGKLTKAYNVYN